MSTEEDKVKRSKRLHKEECAVVKQVKIAKSHGMDVKEAHKFAKHHAMDCGTPGCAMCGNPRKIHKDKLTAQEKRLFQDTEEHRDRHSNGLIGGQE
jgi:hypothetical protein